MRIILTDHVRRRMRLRGISEGDISLALRESDRRFSSGDGREKFIKYLDREPLHVIAKRNSVGDWVVLSAWIRGQDDPLPLWWRAIRLPFLLLWHLLVLLLSNVRK
jgi:hypothetical protein